MVLWKWRLLGLSGNSGGTQAQVGSLIYLGHRAGRTQIRFHAFASPDLLNPLPPNESQVRALGGPPSPLFPGLLFGL